MYKRQFKKWGWCKYRRKGLYEPGSSSHGAKHTREAAGAGAVTTTKPGTVQAICVRQTSQPVPIEPSQDEPTVSSYKSTLSASVYEFVRAAQHSPSWQATSKFQSLCKHHSVGGEFGRGLDALGYDNVLGFQIIKKLFVLVETHMGNPNVTSFIELCFLIPRALLFSGREDILALYLDQIEGFSQLEKVDGSLRGMISAICCCRRVGGDSGLEDLLTFASAVWADVLTEKRGRVDRSALLSTWDCIRLGRSIQLERVKKWLREWEQLHEECMSVHGRHAVGTLYLEDDLSHLLHPTRIYPEASLEEAKIVVDEVRRKHFLIPAPGVVVAPEPVDTMGLLSIPAPKQLNLGKT